MHQLDIFDDSRDRVLLNRLADAWCAENWAAAQNARHELSKAFRADRHLGGAAVLTQTLAEEQAQVDVPLLNHGTAAQARSRLEGPVLAAAQDVLGEAAAKPWLAGRWRALARRAEALPFDGSTPDTHAAALWLQGRG